MSNATRQILFFCTVLLFVCVITLILFYGSGYRINWRNGDISETSDISVIALPETATITLQPWNSAKITPAHFTQLVPGSYRITVAAEGYTSQMLTVDLMEQSAVQFDPIQLWPIEPKTTPLKTTTKLGGVAPLTTMFNNNPATLYKNPRFKQWLLQQSNTLYVYDLSAGTTTTLVRLAEPITAVAWHPNGWYVLYSTASQLHVIDSRTEYTMSDVILVTAPDIKTISCETDGWTCSYVSYDQTFKLALR